MTGHGSVIPWATSLGDRAMGRTSRAERDAARAATACCRHACRCRCRARGRDGTRSNETATAREGGAAAEVESWHRRQGGRLGGQSCQEPSGLLLLRARWQLLAGASAGGDGAHRGAAVPSLRQTGTRQCAGRGGGAVCRRGGSHHSVDQRYSAERYGQQLKCVPLAMAKGKVKEWKYGEWKDNNASRVPPDKSIYSAITEVS